MDNKKRKTKKGIPLWFIIIVLFLFLAFVALGAMYTVAVYYYAAYQKSAPISYADIRPNQYVSYIYDYTGKEIDKLHGEENREYAAISEIPANLKNAVIAIEDQRFYEHPGVDLEGIGRAVYVNLREGAFIEGASTITQQLVKNNLIKDNTVDIDRKIEEQCVAYKLESDLIQKLGSKKAAKDFVLEQYLNLVNLAHGINGVKLAALYYFGKNLEDLTLAESASIAAIIKNPVRFSPVNSKDDNWERTKTVLFRMLEQQLISYKEYDDALDEEIYRVSEHSIDNADNEVHTYFVDQVINDVARDLMFQQGLSKAEAYKLVYSGGLSIYTTFDQEIQDIIDQSMSDSSLFPSKNTGVNVYVTFETEQGTVRKYEFFTSDSEADKYVHQQRQSLSEAGYSVISESVQKIIQPQAAFAIIDYKTGRVPAIGAGRGEKKYNLAFNRATQAKRQPGSCFKILAAYLPALDTGLLTADSLIEDTPFTVHINETNEDYSPNNYDFRFRGSIPLRTAIRDSINVAAVKTLVTLGYQTAYDYLLRLGFTTLVESRESTAGKIYTDRGPSLALGGLTDGVTSLELAGAFGAIANKGEFNRPVFYTRVLAHDGSVLLENKISPVQVIKPETSYILTDMMQSVVKNGTGTEARFKRIDVPIAGKTGTSTDDKDLSFAGYTPYYVGAVWQGYDTPKELHYDKNFHLSLWRTIMENVHILKGFTEGSFDLPE